MKLIFVALCLIATVLCQDYNSTYYCETFAAACPADFARDFGGEVSTCMDYATNWITGTSFAENSLRCRAYHAEVARDVNATVHCPHASISGGDVCGSACDNYCQSMEISCSNYTVYDNATQCQRACDEMTTTSIPSDVSENTVECRIYHASVAFRDDAATHCPHADMNGGEVCGTRCESYCQNQIGYCGEFSVLTAQESCENICELGMGSEPGDQGGPSFDCREYHNSVAVLTQTDTIHCPHADPITENAVCGDACAQFCELHRNGCEDDFSYGASSAHCEAMCANFPVGHLGNQTGNSLACRSYHILAGLGLDQPDNADGHCGHSSIFGDGVCGDVCENYCFYMEATCSDQYDADTCMTECEALGAGTGHFADSGNSIQCRMYHLGAAMTDSATHCPHAAGESVCVGSTVADTTGAATGSNVTPDTTGAATGGVTEANQTGANTEATGNPAPETSEDGTESSVEALTVAITVIAVALL